MSNTKKRGWSRVRETEDFELPSGEVVKLYTTINPWTLIQAGLTDEKALNGGATIMEYNDMMGKVLSKVLIAEPRVGNDEEAEENDEIMPLSLIPLEDFTVLMEKAQEFFAKQGDESSEETANANTFPDESGSDGDSEDGEVLGDDASSGTGDSAGDDGVAEDQPGTGGKAKPRRSRAKSGTDSAE